MQQNSFYIVKYNSQIELAALIAALSRFLNYPRGSAFMERPNPIEVWIKNDSCELVLNETAKEAVIKEFGAFNYLLLQSCSQSPDNCKLVISGNKIIPMGLTEVELFLKEIDSPVK